MYSICDTECAPLLVMLNHRLKAGKQECHSSLGSISVNNLCKNFHILITFLLPMFTMMLKKNGTFPDFLGCLCKHVE